MKWLNKISPRIRHGGCRYFSKGIINPWRIISDHEYFIFEEGSGALIINGIDYPCPEKSFIIIPPGKRHISYAYSNSVLLHWGHFDWIPTNSQDSLQTFMEPASPDADKFNHAPEFIPDKIICGKISDSQIFVLLQQLEMKLKSESNFEQMLTSVTALELFLRLFLQDSHSRRKKKSDTYSSAEELRLHLTSIAHEPMDKMIPLEQNLRIGGYSYSRQERIFKKAFGITPHQYITLLRVERIKQMLNDKTMTISDIADEMGFRDLAYFSRYVSKHLGASPRNLLY